MRCDGLDGGIPGIIAASASADDSSVNSLSADSHLGSSQLPGGSTLESVQSNVLGDSFSPSIIGSARLLGTVGSLSNDVVAAIAPVEAAVQPVLTTVTDTVGSLSNDVVGSDRAGRGGGAAGAHDGDRHRRQSEQ